jgi:hypothetical protein
MLMLNSAQLSMLIDGGYLGSNSFNANALAFVGPEPLLLDIEVSGAGRLLTYVNLMPIGDVCFRFLWRSAMSKLGMAGATALSLAFAVATPALATRLRVGVGGSGPMRLGKVEFHNAQPSIGSLGPRGANAAYCRQRWPYYDPASGTYMGDDGIWRPCR